MEPSIGLDSGKLYVFSGRLLTNLLAAASWWQRRWRLTRIAVVGCGIFVLSWGYLYSPPETFFRFMANTGTIYSASVLLTTAAGLYWKKANTVGTLASLVVAGTLPLTSIFLGDSDVLKDLGYQWLVEDKVVGIATFVLSFVCVIVASLLTQKSHPPKPLAARREGN